MQPGYVYVISRKDIPQPHLSVQIAHAVLAATNAYGNPNITHPNLVVCVVDNEKTLDGIFNRLKEAGVKVCGWTEEDMGRQLTAIATGILFGDERRHFRRLKLLC
jgi:hypothetical protein